MSSAQARSESSSQAPRAPRPDSEAPKSGIRVSANVRVSAKGGTLGGVGPSSVGVPRPIARATEDADTYVDSGASKLPVATEAEIPEAPASRSARAAVRPRPSRTGSPASAVRLAPAQSAVAQPAVEATATLATVPAKKLVVPPPSVPAPSVAKSALAVSEAPATTSAAEEIPAPTPSSAYRSLTTTAQDWPVAKVPDSQPASSLPTFGSPPPGAPNPTRFSMPAFLPPAELAQAQILIREKAANDAASHPMDLAFDASLDVELPQPAPLGVRLKSWAETLPRPVVLAIGVALGVAGMALAR